MRAVRPGCVLIASPTLRDPNFSRTVVLVCEHTSSGSIGLVLNRPTTYGLGEALSHMPGGVTQPLYWGGPVQNEMVLVLHRTFANVPQAKPIGNGMALGSDSNALVEILRATQDAHKQVRVFAGYAGWGSGQLEREMRQHGWLIGDPPAELVFETNAVDVWEHAVRTLGPKFAYLATVPSDPRVN